MAINNWPLLMFVLMLPLPARGQDACYGETWTYHNHTHSCFKDFEDFQTWPEARDHCRQVQLGSNYGVTTHLAKIDDSETNNFVIGFITPLSQVRWIGLHYNTDKNAFRWDGYPDEIPKFTASPWFSASEPYVAIFGIGWYGRDGRMLNPFVCQHTAKRIGKVTCQQDVQPNGLNITCTSDVSPVKAKCLYTYRYEDTNFLNWFQANRPRYVEVEEGTSFTTACSVRLINFHPGTITVQFKMYPDINGTDLSSNQKALSTGSITTELVPPDVPQLRIFGGQTLEASSTVVCVEDAAIDLACSVTSGYPPLLYSLTISCEFPLGDSVENYEHTVSGNDAVIRKMVSRDMHGRKCTCIGYHLTGNVQSSPLTFLVVSRPSDVTCSIDLLSHGLKVSCEIGQVYPEASCQWFYHNEMDLHSRSVSEIQINDYNHQNYTDVDGSVYYKSICSVTLTHDATAFRPGRFTVKIKINPDLRGIYLSMTNDTSTSTQKIVNICKYINCFFVATIDFPVTENIIQQLLEALI